MLEARHYKGIENNKPQFEYHKQSIEYLKNKIPKDIYCQIMGQLDQQNNIDIEKAQNSPKSKYMAGPMGFEPMTFSLEG